MKERQQQLKQERNHEAIMSYNQSLERKRQDAEVSPLSRVDFRSHALPLSSRGPPTGTQAIVASKFSWTRGRGSTPRTYFSR